MFIIYSTFLKVMSLDETAGRIMQEYQFGRFVNFFENMRQLKYYLINPEKENAGNESDMARNILINFAILDQVRFKEVLEWTVKKEGNFPDLWMRHHHMNILSNFSDDVYQNIPFYRNSPTELKTAGQELHQMCFKFYRLNMRKPDPDYRHGPENLLEDAEKTIILAKVVLDSAHDYISRLCKKI